MQGFSPVLSFHNSKLCTCELRESIWRFFQIVRWIVCQACLQTIVYRVRLASKRLEWLWGLGKDGLFWLWKRGRNSVILVSGGTKSETTSTTLERKVFPVHVHSCFAFYVLLLNEFLVWHQMQGWLDSLDYLDEGLMQSRTRREAMGVIKPEPRKMDDLSEDEEIDDIFTDFMVEEEKKVCVC